MLTALYIVQIVIGIAIITLVVLQGRSEGAGGIFGQAEGLSRSRRGVDRTLFQLTIVFSVLFLVVAIITSLIAQR
ncbi:MAG: preprotein translocase subunit SecG [Anaerolineae bacterium]